MYCPSDPDDVMTNGLLAFGTIAGALSASWAA